MNPAWVIVLGLLVPTILAVLWALAVGDIVDNPFPQIVAGVFVLALLGFFIGGLGLSLGRHYGRVACHTFAAQTHRPTRFVVYTSWDGGDCLTRTAGGKWIPTKNLREFGETP